MDRLERVVQSAKTGLPILLATCDGEGQPHIASASGLEQEGEHWVTLKDWFCPVTNRNIETNRRVALVIRENSGAGGYQLTGTVEDVKEMAVLNGFAPGMKEEAFPQTERKLVVRVERILAFSHGAHTDSPLE